MIKAFTIYPMKFGVGIMGGFISLLWKSVIPLIAIVTVFEIADFLTGCMKSYVVSKRNKVPFAFESVKAWRTIYKFVFIVAGIVLAEMLDYVIAGGERLKLANYFTGFCCGVEFWSFLENAAVISNARVFVWLRKWMKFKAEEKIGMKLDEDE